MPGPYGTSRFFKGYIYVRNDLRGGLADCRTGQPEPKYDGTRHNAGFEALDYLAAQWQCDIAKAKWQGLYGTAQVNGHKVVLLKPLTT